MRVVYKWILGCAKVEVTISKVLNEFSRTCLTMEGGQHCMYSMRSVASDLTLGFCRHWAAGQGREDMLQTLIKFCDKDAKDIRGWTALAHACSG